MSSDARHSAVSLSYTSGSVGLGYVYVTALSTECMNDHE